MKIKIGEIITSSLLIDIQYRCSHCGCENLIVEKIEVSSDAPSMLGMTFYGTASRENKEALKEKIDLITDENNIHRFKKLAFSCECRNCKHSEPWARMNYDYLVKPTAISVASLIFSSILLISAYTSGADGSHLFSWLFFILSTASSIAILIHKAKNNRKMEKLISRLPPESIPKFYPYSSERHELFEEINKIL